MIKQRKKIILFLLIILVPFVIFYFLNFDFKKGKDFACNSFCKESQIPDSWLDRYGINIENTNTIKDDLDKDGLNLLEEYNNSTNPLDPDTDKDGYNDGKEVRDGYNPIGEGRMDLDRDGLPDFWEKEVGLDTKKNDYKDDNDNDGLWNYNELAHGTDPLLADSDRDGFNDWDEIKNGYDPVAPGDTKPKYEVIIKKINVQAPLVWSLNSDEESMLEDLKWGVVRYPDTGIPGQRGNVVISGHSSNYIWADGSYNYVFKDLNNLTKGDEIIVKATQRNGKTFEYKYKVSGKNIVASDDASIFQSSEKPSLTLVTCWPLRTNWKRLIIQAQLQ